jgi:hypothetical protein
MRFFYFVSPVSLAGCHSRFGLVALPPDFSIIDSRFQAASRYLGEALQHSKR